MARMRGKPFSEQLKSWSVCQICGFALPREQTSPDHGWLVSPLREDPSLDVIRCPAHISEWSLRRSEAGRTKEWRQRKELGKDFKPIDNYLLAPLPVRDLESHEPITEEPQRTGHAKGRTRRKPNAQPERTVRRVRRQRGASPVRSRDQAD